MSGFDDYLASASKPAAPAAAPQPAAAASFDEYLKSAPAVATPSDTQAAQASADRTATLADNISMPGIGLLDAGGQMVQNYLDSHLSPNSMIRQGADAVIGNGVDAGAAFTHAIHNIPLSVAQLAAHGASAVAPSLAGNAANALDQYATSREQTYQSGIPNDVGSIAGAVAGNVLPFAVGGEASAGARLADMSDALTGGVKAIPKVGGIAQKVLSGALQGGAYSLAQPITAPGQSYGSALASRLGTGVALGGAVPIVGNALGSAYNVARPFVNPAGVVRDYLGNLLGDQAASVAQKLRAAPTYVPGSLPTSAQAAAVPELVQAEKALANQSPDFKTALLNRDVENNAARWSVLSGLAGTKADMDAALKARRDAVEPFASQYLSSTTPANRWSGAVDAFGSLASNPGRMSSNDFNAVTQANKIAQKVRSGAIQEDDALEQLKELGDSVTSKKAQDAFQAAHDAINQNMVDPTQALNALKTLRYGPLGVNPERAASLDSMISSVQNARNINGLVGTDMLDAVRQEAGKLARSSSGQNTLAYAPANDSLVQAINRVAPGYPDYLRTYAAASQPITDMAAASEMVDSLGGRTLNSAGSPQITLPAINSQLKGLEKLPYDVSPQMQSALEGIQNDVQRSTISNSVRAPGSDTAYNLSTPGWLASKVYGKQMGQDGAAAALARKIPWLGPMLTSVKDVGSSRVLNAAQNAMLNPAVMAQELERLRASNPGLLRMLGPAYYRSPLLTAPPSLPQQASR